MQKVTLYLQPLAQQTGAAWAFEKVAISCPNLNQHQIQLYRTAAVSTF
jgi:hypothetical protein